MTTFITFLNAVIVYLSSSNVNSPQQAKEACLYKFQNFLECVLQSMGPNKDPKNTDKYFRVNFKMIFQMCCMLSQFNVFMQFVLIELLNN